MFGRGVCVLLIFYLCVPFSSLFVWAVKHVLLIPWTSAPRGSLITGPITVLRQKRPKKLTLIIEVDLSEGGKTGPPRLVLDTRWLWVSLVLWSFGSTPQRSIVLHETTTIYGSPTFSFNISLIFYIIGK